MPLQEFYYKEPFVLENGAVLPELTIVYHTYGTLNADKTNVIWVCHALTANSNTVDWWPGIVGEGCTINPEEYFIVCANILGSCYGTTGPQSSNNSTTGESYRASFPMITIRDMVNAHILLRKHLDINTIHLLVGGSMGGYQALEWAVMESDRIKNLFLLATSATESAWGIAIHTAQRLAIEADSTWNTNVEDAGANGLKAARAIGILTYRNYNLFAQHQTDTDNNKIDGFKASSYISYQGDKLVKRFNALSYWILTKAMDSHNISRGRAANCEAILQQIHQPILLIGISSDLLCPVEEQRFLAAHIPSVTYEEIDSSYGHDGFLIESERISNALSKWLKNKQVAI